MAATSEKRVLDLEAGPVEYRDSGDGPPMLFLHGLLADGQLWRDVVPQLAGRARCVVPDLPLGSHRRPMASNADLSPPGIARLIGELIDRLELGDGLTIVANDTGGALTQLLVAERPQVAARLVLTPCDCFDYFFPPLFRPLQLAARAPGGLGAALQPLRIRALRRLPIAYGWLTKRPLPNELTDAWLRPFYDDAGIRRDATKLVRAIDKSHTLAAAERLDRFSGPVLVVWAREDKVFPPDYGRQLAERFSAGHFELIDDSYTFLPLDQPQRLAELIAGFIDGGSATAR